MRYLLTALLMIFSISLVSISIDDIRFCLDHDYLDILSKNEAMIEELIDRDSLSLSDWDTILEYAERSSQRVYPITEVQGIRSLPRQERLNANRFLLKVYLERARRLNSLDDALDWIQLRKKYVGVPIPDVDGVGGLRRHYEEYREDYEAYAAYEQTITSFRSQFDNPADQLVIDSITSNDPTELIIKGLPNLDQYNDYIENLAKASIDDIGVIREDSLAISKIEEFYTLFPHSHWHQTAYYYHLYHLNNSNAYQSLLNLVNRYSSLSTEHAYISVLYLMMPSVRRALALSSGSTELAQSHIWNLLYELSMATDDIQILYDSYSPEYWKNKLSLLKAKAFYYNMIARNNLYGDEENLIAICSSNSNDWIEMIDTLEQITFPDNDRGELAELNYWLGRAYALASESFSPDYIAAYFAKSLAYGSPRNRYDEDCYKYILQLHKISMVKTDPLTWMRQLLDYSGPIFADQTSLLGLADTRFTRIAIGDYNNDGWHDLLFNGCRLYRNDMGTGFTDVSDTTNVSYFPASGGLWADFNRDGRLDYVTLSHDELTGEQLMKNQGNEYFVSVNERAGDIADTYPTEGGAWIDPQLTGYPSLYLANYEKWMQRTGYEDYYHQNNEGYFTDQSSALGFYAPKYATDPGLAGRGVAPADFDNDGIQEILVTNYRLTRNFLWDFQDSIWVDTAGHNTLQGKCKQGYYGHSIGADWGDYDNDGDLDLFIANLAHPRYIEISDVSFLLRNDGPAQRVVEADTLFYWQFTDVTRKAGITYDELHSDPLWVDVDNDGDLDLFITSIYENERSYLYENLGNGSFRDITYLSGARVYNGWGNAMGDLNRDGLADIVVGSGSGTRILINQTPTENKSQWIKPVHYNGEVVFIPSYTEHSDYPNSPAFGTRFEILTQDREGRSFNLKLMRELSSAKGTSSQSCQELHFGLGTRDDLFRE